MTLYGCHDREPFEEIALVQNGWSSDGRRQLVEIPAAGSKDCQYAKGYLGQTDPSCSGCRWRRDEA